MWQDAYNEAKEILGAKDLTYKEYDERLDRVVEGETNLDSIVAKITMQYESTDLSKAALKDTVAGHKEVLEVKKTLRQAKANLKKTEAKLSFLDDKYTLFKKAMDGEIATLKQFREGIV